MNLFLALAFLFFIGSVAGWGIEVLFRRFFSNKNPERKWMNPGFCTGPYLPLYGSGLFLMYLIAAQEGYLSGFSPWGAKAVLFAAMAVCMTAIEYIAGIYSLRVNRVRLWDYTDQWGNIQGVICPKFSLAWALLGALYYFLIHPHILNALSWLSRNLAFSFVIGMFFGVFAVDVGHSARIVSKLKAFARENGVVVRYDAVKAHIRNQVEQNRQKYHFFRPFHSERPLPELLEELKDRFEKRREHVKKTIRKGAQRHGRHQCGH